MAESFEIRPFEECIEKIKYTTKIASQDFKESGRFPIISQEEAVISGYWDNPEDVFHINKPVVIFGDHSRHIKYVDFDFVIGADGVKILSPVKSINAKYFYYFLKWLDIPSLGYSRHYKALKEKSVKVFSETCQQRIVDELDLLTGIIDKKNAQLRDLDTLAQSIFYEMFGNVIANEKKWPFGRFADICAPRSSIKRASKSYLPSDSIEYIDISSIDNKRQKLTGTTAFVFSDAPSRAQQVVQYEDVLISMVRPNLKNIAVVDLDHNRLVASSGFCVLRANNRSTPSFIKSIIGTDAFTQYLMDRVTGANYPAVKEDDIKGCRIGIPPVDLQRRFAERAAVIERQKQLISSAIDEVGSLLSGRMDLYFNE